MRAEAASVHLPAVRAAGTELIARRVAGPVAGKSFGGYSSLINGGNGEYGGDHHAFQAVIPP
ncbi:MAG: hypothetical protein ACREQI_13820 [Candidatus Binataceae bacterium]